MLYPVKIEFKDYPSGSWQDWSEYLYTPPTISKKVESENDGEAGAITFDSAKVILRNISGSPVNAAFSIDLSSKQRYLFRIYAIKTNKTYVQLFEGIADFSTLDWPEDGNLVSFDLLDKISALNILQNTPVRTLRSLKDSSVNHLPWLLPLDYANGDYYIINVGTGSQVVFEVIKYLHPSFTPQHVDVGSTVVVPAGTILKRQETDIDKYLFARSSYLFEANNPGENDTWLEPAADSDEITGSYRIDSSDSDAYLISDPTIKLKYYKDEFYSLNICNTSYYWDTQGYWKTEVTSFKGEKMLQNLFNNAWPGIPIIFRGFSSFNIPYSYWRKTMDENPFNKTPLEAVKMLADTMKVYIYTDKSGNIIIQLKSALATSGITRSIGTTKIIKKPKRKYFWDKIVDGVIVNVESWLTDDTTGESLVGTSELTKQPSGFTTTQKIKPKNQITKNILAGNASVDTQEELDALAGTEALSFLNFYGLRHSCFDVVLNLDDNTINWELIDNLILSGLTTFFTTLEFDLVDRTVTLEPVEIEGHDYDLRQIVVGSSESSSSGSSSGSSTSYSSSGANYLFDIPLVVSGGIVSLAKTGNLKITSNQLDTIQDIKTTDSPTFNQITITADPSTVNHVVKAGRNISTSYPLSGGGNLTLDRTLSLNYNATNLKLTSNALNTIQDIATTSSPTFAGLTLNGNLTINTNGTSIIFSSYKGTDSLGYNIFLGGGGLSSIGDSAATYKGSYNVAVGYQSMNNNTQGYQNVAFGYRALYSNTTGFTSVALGHHALYSQQTGDSNIGIGYYANYTNVSGSKNVAIGYQSLYLNTGSNNVGVGYYTLRSTTGNANAAFGHQALYSNTTGNNNTAIGADALIYMQTGSANVAIGFGAGWYKSDGSTNVTDIGYSTLIGYYAKPLNASGDINEIVIGYNAVGVGSNSVVIGNDSITKTILKGSVGIGNTAPSFNLDVTGTGRFSTTLQVDSKAGIGKAAGTEVLEVNGNTKQYGNIYSDNFNGVDPYLGYYIGKSGSIFSKITANELHVKYFIADLEQALAGSQVISKSVAKVNNDVTLPSTIGSTFTLCVESFDGFPSIQVFQINDILRLRSGHNRTASGLNITDSWGKVTSFIADGDSGRIQYWLVQLVAGATSANIKAGTIVNDYGQSGNGIIESIAINPLGNSPYHQIATWTTAPYTDLKVQDRRGDLTGITSANFGALTGFGGYSQKFYAEGNVYISGNIWALTGGIGGTYSAPVITLSNYGMKINSNGTATALTANSIMLGNITGSAASGLKLTNTGTNSTSGLFGYNSTPTEIFALRLDGTAQIANWSFDGSKLYTTDVRLESSASLKGLGISSSSVDVLKVGDFTNATESYTTSTMPNAPNPSTAWTNEVNTYSYQFGWITYGASFGAKDDVDAYYQSSFRTYLTLPIADIKGKTIKISFEIAEQENTYGSDKVTPLWAYIKTDIGTFALTDVTPTNSVYLIGNTPTYESRTLTCTIPSDATYARLYFAWYKNTTSSYVPATVKLQNWSFSIYSRTIIELNKKGLKIFNSPISRILLNNDEAVFDLPFIKASSGFSVGNWTFVVEPYLEGDGITVNERLTLKYKGTSKGYFSQTDGTYTHI